MSRRRGLLRGLQSAGPICLGYIPVAITFGAVATSFGYPFYVPLLFSAAIFAGGTQFILLAALHDATPWPYVVALCALIDSRHIVYGAFLRRIFPARLTARVPLAMGLTDEVFATALTQRDARPGRQLTAWLAGLAAAAYLSWVAGTALGAVLGTVISHAAPALTHALDFALPALFLALSLDNLNRETAAPLLAGAGAALGAVWVGNIALAMAAGVAAAVAVAAWRHRSAAS
ncbi:Branched-chain amino acid permease protein [Salinisphaera shabanensis E1L3A]|uniref:Branched-chain amino acid permease protein n=1 Tax=Salinisphaera shabanensis E1L3A TaxID=1033802 RepID=U2E7G5_9GAMM|nr:AzlC family ABC transporter permease [Salinisphaera shabanensis]ERJ19681.1 Branched-chain amino acid permease protein [Salinisphaera shabanensis E1L3A]